MAALLLEQSAERSARVVALGARCNGERDRHRVVDLSLLVITMEEGEKLRLGKGEETRRLPGGAELKAHCKRANCVIAMDWHDLPNGQPRRACSVRMSHACSGEILEDVTHALHLS